MPQVFISYRVRDEGGYAALLDRCLTERLGPDAVFCAPRSIRPGDDFTIEILRSLRACDVLLAVVGRRWSAPGGPVERGDRETDVDWVRREIAEAFAAGIRVVPVLVEDAGLPDRQNLPADIARLVTCHCLAVRHRSLGDDLRRVADEISRLLPRPPHGPGAPDAEAPAAAPQLYRLTGPVPGTCRIGVTTGSILRVRCADAWVNSENTDMQMSRVTECSISGIIRYWGARRDRAGRVIDDSIAMELAAAVGDIRPVMPGAVVTTGGGALADTHNVRYVLHVAAVQGEPGHGFRQVRDVGRCVTNALVEAERLAAAGHPVRSVLVPVLGGGVAGAPVRPTVRTLVHAAVDHLRATPGTALRFIHFLAFTNAERDAFGDVLRAVPAVERDSGGIVPATTPGGVSMQVSVVSDAGWPRDAEPDDMSFQRRGSINSSPTKARPGRTWSVGESICRDRAPLSAATAHPAPASAAQPRSGGHQPVDQDSSSGPPAARGSAGAGTRSPVHPGGRVPG